MVMLENGISGAMNARIIGSGHETMVLAHGYGGDQSFWDKMIPFLTNNVYQVLIFDWPCSGAAKFYDPEKYNSFEAFADDLINLMDELKLSSAVFVGHSMSGIIGCIASVKRPDLFSRLVLLAASPRYINAEDYIGGFEKSDIDGLISSIESDLHNWATGFAPLAVDPKDPDSVEKFTTSLQKMRPEVAVSVAATVFYSDEREILEKVTTPCTIVQPQNDIVVPTSVAYYMLDKIKGRSTVEVIEMSGHCPHLTAHIQLLDVLSGVLGFSFKNDVEK